MAWVEAIATVTFLFLIVIWFTTKKRSAIGEWPVLGMWPGFLINGYRIHEYSSNLLKLTKNTVEMKGPWFSNMNFIWTSDPRNIHYVLSTESTNFNKGPAFKKIFEGLGDGILAAESESWKWQRKLIHSLFRRTGFLSLVEITSKRKIETGLFEILDHASDDGSEVDIQDLLQRFTFDLTCIFLLGSDPNSLTVDLPPVPLAKAIDDMEEVQLYRHLKPISLWKLQKWLQAGTEKKAANAEKTIDSFVYKQISDHKQVQIKKNKRNGEADQEGFDLISSFLLDEVAVKRQIKDKPVETFLRDSVISILTAGRDTTATALSWFFWLVSTNPHVESKIREEIQITFQMKAGDPWLFPSYPIVNKLIYLHATLCETLRLYPPVPFNHKASIKPDILPSGHRVNKETSIIISVYTMGRMEEIWGADCCEFRPERWISEKGTILDMPSFKFNVFGAGPRACVGKDLAFREMKAVAAAVIWRYNIRVIEDHPVIPAKSVILHMQHGLKAHVAKI